MLDYIRKLWKIEDLRKKILYTFGMLILFRLVGCIPAPGIDLSRLGMNESNLPLLDIMNMMTGGQMSQMTIMAMGISPYINASIIMQLLCIALPALERMQQEEDGREKINRISRYVTIALAVVQAIGLSKGLGYAKSGLWNNILIGVSMAGGTALAMWIGERITEKGIGNGISLLIFAGIVSNLFNGIVGGFRSATTVQGFLGALVILVVLVILTFVVTFVDLGERRIPLQIAKQVKGRRVYGGQNTHMTLKVIAVGVMPLIFAYSFLSFPGTIGQMVAPHSGFTAWCTTYLKNGAWLHLILSAILIFAFTFFYSSISFDAKKQAEQLQQQGATIPGRRGKEIAAFLQRITNRLNLFAALFLAVLAAIPTLMLSGLNLQVPFAASSMLIAVSVSLETMRTIKGEMAIRGIESDKDNGFM
ncbi:MAG: preprotein translocase subunit SecY [Aristaeellaceae bacterium]